MEPPDWVLLSYHLVQQETQHPMQHPMQQETQHLSQPLRSRLGRFASDCPTGQ